MTDLEKKFFNEMRNIYVRADKECGYRATRFLQMLGEKGGVGTAKSLISRPEELKVLQSCGNLTD